MGTWPPWVCLEIVCEVFERGELHREVHEPAKTFEESTKYSNFVGVSNGNGKLPSEKYYFYKEQT